MKSDRTAARASVIAGLVAATLLLAACQPLLVVGDSVTWYSSQATSDQLTAQGWTPTVDGIVGRTTAEGLSVVQAKRADASYFVIALGYNDAADAVTYRDRLWAILAELRDAKTVWVVNLNESRPYYRTANQIIAASPLWFPNMKVIDWASAANANPGAVSDDGVHLTDAGNVIYAATLAKALGSAPS